MYKDIFDIIGQGKSGLFEDKETQDFVNGINTLLQLKTGLPFNIDESEKRAFKAISYDGYIQYKILSAANDLRDLIIKNNITDKKLESMTLQEYQDLCKKHFKGKCTMPTQEMFDAFKKIVQQTGLTDPDVLRYAKKEMFFETGGTTHEISEMMCKLRIIELIADTPEKAQLLNWEKHEKLLSKKLQEYRVNANTMKFWGAYFTIGIIPTIRTIGKLILDANIEKQVSESKKIGQKAFVDLLKSKCANANSQYFETFIYTPDRNGKQRNFLYEIDITLPIIATEKTREIVVKFAGDFDKAIKSKISLPTKNVIETGFPEINRWTKFKMESGYAKNVKQNMLSTFDNRTNANKILSMHAKNLANFILKNNITDKKLENMTLQEYQKMCKEFFGQDSAIPTQEMFDSFKKIAKQTGLTNPDMLKFIKITKALRPGDFITTVATNMCKVAIAHEITPTPEQKEKVGIAEIEKLAKSKIKKILPVSESNVPINFILYAYPIISLSIWADIFKTINDVRKNIPEAKNMSTKEALQKINHHIETMATNNQETQVENLQQNNQYREMIEDLATDKDITIFQGENTYGMIETRYESEQAILVDIMNGIIPNGSIIDLDNLIVYSQASKLFDEIDKEDDLSKQGQGKLEPAKEEYSI